MPGDAAADVALMERPATTELRRLDGDGVATVVDWAAGEGWDPGLHDAVAFRTADPEGFLGAFVGEELGGAVSAVRYGAGLGFIGLFIVRPPFRRLLLGVRLGRAALERLEGRCIGTDGVPAQQRQYERLGGFRTAWRTVRCRGLVPPASGAAARGLDVVPAAAIPFDDLAEYDAAHFGARRDAFLHAWTRLPGHRAVVALRGPAPGAAPVACGFGVLRACREGTRIGPLFADDAAVAEVLFARLTVAGGDVTLDTPETNPHAVALARRHGLRPVFETARMYRGGDPGLPVERIYGITSFELG